MDQRPSKAVGKDIMVVDIISVSTVAGVDIVSSVVMSNRALMSTMPVQIFSIIVGVV